MDALKEHPVYGEEAALWWASIQPTVQLPKDLRAMNAGSALVSLEDIVGSGPAMWLWLDASSPSTTVQLSVLDQMMASQESKRWQKGWTWVVVDAGNDWEAFQRLNRQAIARYGSLSRMPYLLIHTAGDVRWTEAFEVSALPCMRRHGPDRKPFVEWTPLPGPELSRLLSKRP